MPKNHYNPSSRQTGKFKRFFACRRALAMMTVFGLLGDPAGARASAKTISPLARISISDFDFSTQALALPEGSAIAPIKPAGKLAPLDTVILRTRAPIHRLLQKASANDPRPGEPTVNGWGNGDPPYARAQYLANKLSKLSLKNSDQVQEVIRQLMHSPRAQIALEKLIKPAKNQGGLLNEQNPNSRVVRTMIWGELLAHAFGGTDNIPSPVDRKAYVATLGSGARASMHLLIRDRLPVSGYLRILNHMYGAFEAYARQDYTLEMKNVFPVRIWFDRACVGYEFLPIVEDRSQRVLNVYVGRLPRELFQTYKNATVFADTNSYGRLTLGGGRPSFDGTHTVNEFWADFGPAHCYERLAVHVDRGIIKIVDSLESHLHADFQQVWDPQRRCYVSSYWKNLTSAQFHTFPDQSEIHGVPIGPWRYLKIASAPRLFILKAQRGAMRLDLLLRNATGHQAAISWALDQMTGQLLPNQNLGLIYAVSSPSKEDSFKTGPLINQFEQALSPSQLYGRKGMLLRNYILRVHLDRAGSLERIGLGIRFPSLRWASAEVKVINEIPRYLKFLSDRFGNPIWTLHAEPVILPLDGKDRSPVLPALSDTRWVGVLRRWQRQLRRGFESPRAAAAWLLETDEFVLKNMAGLQLPKRLLKPIRYVYSLIGNTDHNEEKSMQSALRLIANRVDALLAMVESRIGDPAPPPRDWLKSFKAGQAA